MARSFFELSAVGRFCLQSIGLLIFTFAFFVMILGLLNRRAAASMRLLRVFSVVAFLLVFADLTALSAKVNVLSGDMLSFVYGLPLWTHVLLFSGCASLSLLRLLRIRRIYAAEFTASSVRQAINNLPTGICFADRDGVPLLTNRSMYAAAEEITGGGLRNLFAFWENAARICGADPLSGAMTLSPDGVRMLHLTRKEIPIRGELFTQVLAADVTALYSLYKKQALDNSALAEQRKKLKELSDSLVQANHEEEVLRHKIRLHNEIGRTVVATRRFLSAEAFQPENIRIYSVLWRELCDKNSFMNLTPESGRSRELDEIFRTSEQIGCEIRMTGAPPAGEENARVFRQLLREAVVNAVRHAGATALFVEISHADGCCRIRVTDNGRPPENKITEGGGLSDLRRHVELTGGVMRIAASERFQLEIELMEDPEE